MNPATIVPKIILEYTSNPTGFSTQTVDKVILSKIQDIYHVVWWTIGYSTQFDTFHQTLTNELYFSEYEAALATYNEWVNWRFGPHQCPFFAPVEGEGGEGRGDGGGEDEGGRN